MAIVGLDLRALDPNFKAHAGRGIGRYVAQLVQAIEAEADFLEQHGVRIRKLSTAEICLPCLQERVVNMLPAGRQTVRNQFLLGRKLSSLGVDLMHYFAHGDAPALFGPPAIVTVLDLIPLRFPELYRAAKSSARFRFARYLENRIIKNAAGIVAISEHTKRDLVSLLGISPNKVAVTPLAVDDMFSALGSAHERMALRGQLLQRWSFTTECPLLFYVGGIDPRKNVPFLLEVFDELCGAFACEKRPVLAIAGRIEQDDHYPAFARKVSSLQNADRVKVLGYIDDANLVELYRASTLFLFPSLYEGFGFPVLESMSCGCPVIAGRNSSIPEVMGDMPSMISESSVSAWVEKIRQILGDETTQREMIALGLKRAQLFSWKRTAQLTIEAYRGFMREKSSFRNSN